MYFFIVAGWSVFLALEKRLIRGPDGGGCVGGGGGCGGGSGWGL